MNTDAPPESASDGGESPDPPGFDPGTVFGRYTIAKKLGVGGMGAVYEAVHGDLRKRVALKTLHPEIARNPAMRARFLQEGQAASSIRHPHVVDVSDVGVEAGMPYLVMEYLEGESLAARMARERPMDVAAAVDVMIPVLAAVSAAHAEGVVHRDLKPDNIFLARTRDGMVVPKVLDFGISKVTDAKHDKNLTATSAMMGTPHYMSPEQTQGSKNVDGRTDQYALGVILYECLTGSMPFDGDSLYNLMHAIMSAPVAQPRSLNPAIPEGFERAILRALERDPANRFASVRDLGRELLTWAGPETRMVWDRVFGSPSVVPMAPPVADGPALRTPAPASAPPRSDPALALGDTLQPGANLIAPKPARSRRGLALALAAAAVAGVVALVAVRRPAPHAPAVAPTVQAAPTPVAPPRYEVEVEVTPATATLALDGEAAATGVLRREFPRDGSAHTLRVAAPGYETQSITFRDAPPARIITLAAVPAPAVSPAAVAPVAAAPAAPRRPTPPAAARPAAHPAQPSAAPSVGINGAPFLE
ncbi:MAG: serine/threonine-protein kinase [Myxococcales bacterium]|nr:serine/threonine-protein kinase [Myxococcales bacterium]